MPSRSGATAGSTLFRPKPRLLSARDYLQQRPLPLLHLDPTHHEQQNPQRDAEREPREMSHIADIPTTSDCPPDVERQPQQDHPEAAHRVGARVRHTEKPIGVPTTDLVQQIPDDEHPHNAIDRAARADGGARVQQECPQPCGEPQPEVEEGIDKVPHLGATAFPKTHRKSMSPSRWRMSAWTNTWPTIPTQLLPPNIRCSPRGERPFEEIQRG